MKRYDNVGELLQDYREHLGMSQERFAEDVLDVSPRTYGRWERNAGQIGERNLARVAHRTLLPAEALLRLSHDFVTYYNQRTQRFAPSVYEQAFLSRSVLQERLFEFEDDADVREAHGDDFTRIIQNRRHVNPPERSASDAILEEATERAPRLNLILRGHAEEYAGHLLVLPLTERACSLIHAEKLTAAGLSYGDLAEFPRGPVAGLMLYSLYASCSAHAYSLLRRLVEELSVDWDRLLAWDTRLLAYSVTRDGHELAARLGLRTSFLDHEVKQRHETEVVPTCFHARIAELDWLDAYAGRAKRD